LAMSSEADRMTITIRTTATLHKRLLALAKKNRRSLNREAERLLEEAIEVEEAKQAKAAEKPRR
jgi:predicted HicB family RNase H-like nuclease